MTAAIAVAPWIFAGFLALIVVGAVIHHARRPRWRHPNHRAR